VFVAAFIGSPSMNLYEATIEGSSLHLGSQTLSLDDSVYDRRPALRGYEGRKVIVGIRPEDFEDATLVAPTTRDRRITAKVRLTEALGSEIMVHFGLDAPRVDSGDPDASNDTGGDAVGRFNPRSHARAGDVIEIDVAMENLYFFDFDTRLAVEEGS